ncbi:MAG: Uma2 family endonuclease [Planctomycetes bacterium]|nr:Uma2 family endonuclease [Planctomycetota bacterium]MBU4399062.1 Uma2 family endonuclease [Planctomycetota bacterium]MCG2683093.1 Uma2 family endonuclease [Planctomycetales bacterium]
MSISSSIIGQFIPAAMPPEPVCRLAVSQYHEMIAAGILADGDPLEFLEGWLVPTMVKNPPHSTAIYVTTKLLEQVLPAGWHVRSEQPVTSEDSEPEPDVAVVCGGPEQYGRCHPGPRDVALVVEVADASLCRDRSTKKRIYARAGIPVYWIVNMPERRIEVYSDPTGPGESPDYRRHEDYAAGAEVPVLIEGHEAGSIPVAALLPDNG